MSREMISSTTEYRQSPFRIYRKVEWLSMEDKVPPDRREFKPVEIPPATFEAGSPRIHSWEEVTVRNKEKSASAESTARICAEEAFAKRPFRLAR